MWISAGSMVVDPKFVMVTRPFHKFNRETRVLRPNFAGSVLESVI